MITNSPLFFLKPILIIVIFLSTLSHAFGQSTVKGKVVDEEGQPLMLTNVLLLEATDSLLVKGVIADEEGTYAIEKIPAGRFLLSFTMIGYRPIYSSVFEIDGAEHIDQGNTVLTEDITQLEEVEVRARKPLFEQQIDRLTINVENSITSVGSSALEVLERSPGVIVNRANFSVSMGGKEGVVVMINGKTSRIDQSAIVQMLNGMSADNIEKIELITTPPASFDAEGDAGIINIILKKNAEEGTNGSYTLAGGYNGNETASASLNLNHRRGNINFFGNYSFFRNRAPQWFENNRTLQLDGEVEQTNTISTRDPAQNNHLARLGFDYQVGDRTVIGALVSGYTNKWTMDAVNEVTISTNGMVDSRILIPNDEINHWQHLMGNVNLRHTFAKEQQLSVDFDYLYYTNENPTNYINQFLSPSGDLLSSEEVGSGKQTPINIWVGKVNYQAQLGEKVNLETGLKGTFSTFKNDVYVQYLVNDQWVFDPLLTNEFDLDEKIAAAYTSFDIQAGEQTSLKAGLRYEYTDSYLSSINEAGLVDREFGNLFPSLFLSHNLSQSNSLQFSYSRRITRPTFNEMAPFIIFMDPNTFFTGNESLRPAITDAVKMDYRMNNTILSLQYSHDKNAIIRFQPRVDPVSRRQTLASENFDNRNTYSATLTVPVYVGKWWEMQNTAIATYQTTSTAYGSNDQQLELEQTSFRFNTVQSFILPKKFTAELSGFYQSPLFFGVYKMEAMSSVNIGIQKDLGDNKGVLRFSVSNIFETLDWVWTTDQPELNINIESSFVFLPRSYSLSYSRSFGSSKLKKAGTRSTASEEEQRRVDN